MNLCSDATQVRHPVDGYETPEGRMPLGWLRTLISELGINLKIRCRNSFYTFLDLQACIKTIEEYGLSRTRCFKRQSYLSSWLKSHTYLYSVKTNLVIQWPVRSNSTLHLSVVQKAAASWPRFRMDEFQWAWQPAEHVETQISLPCLFRCMFFS